MHHHLCFGVPLGVAVAGKVWARIDHRHPVACLRKFPRDYRA
jgi:hypothetical protein